MSIKTFEILPIRVMEEVFGERYARGEFGVGAYVIRATKLDPPSKPLIVSTIGSAGDNGTAREDIRQYYPIIHKHAITFGEFSRARRDLGIVHLTGGCPGIPYEMARKAKEANPSLFSVAMYPRMSAEDISNLMFGTLPQFTDCYDWVVVNDLSMMKRAMNVGKADISRGYHGGEGSLAELAKAAHEGNVVVSVPLGTRYGVTQNVHEVLAHSYSDRGAVVMVERDPVRAITMPIAEHFANVERRQRVPLSNLDFYAKPGKGKFFVNVRDSPRVTTDSYPHLQLVEQSVFAGVDYEMLMRDFVANVGANGHLKRVDLKEGEAPHILRAFPLLENTIKTELQRMRNLAVGGRLPYKLISHNAEVPLR